MKKQELGQNVIRLIGVNVIRLRHYKLSLLYLYHLYIMITEMIQLCCSIDASGTNGATEASGSEQRSGSDGGSDNNSDSDSNDSFRSASRSSRCCDESAASTSGQFVGGRKHVTVANDHVSSQSIHRTGRRCFV